MQSVKRIFKNVGYEIYQTEYELEANSDTCMFLVVSPHKGTNNRWMLRGSTIAAFDRWGNSTAIEKFFDSEQQLCEFLLNEQIKIYQELVTYLAYEYAALEQEYELWSATEG